MKLIHDEDSRAEALIYLVERLPPNARDLLREAYSMGQAISDKSLQRMVLRNVADRWPRGMTITLAAEVGKVLNVVLAIGKARKFRTRLNSVRAIDDEKQRAIALVRAVDQLQLVDPDLWYEALCVAQAIGDDRWRTSILLTFFGMLPSKHHDLLRAALNVARAIGEEVDRTRALSELAKRLSLGERLLVMREALNTARPIREAYRRTRALRAIADCLPTEAVDIQYELLQDVRSVAQEHGSSDVLRQLAPHWSVMCRAHQLSEFGELSTTLRAFSKAKRENLLAAIEALLPVIHRLGGEKAVRETAQAIIDTAKWWP